MPPHSLRWDWRWLLLGAVQLLLTVIPGEMKLEDNQSFVLSFVRRALVSPFRQLGVDRCSPNPLFRASSQGWLRGRPLHR